MTDERFKQATRGAWVGLIGNMALALMKGIIGFAANSKALLADAAHSASEAARSLKEWSGNQSVNQPSVEDPTSLSGKAGKRWDLLAPVLLMVLGLEIALSSLKSIVSGVTEAPGILALIAVGVSIVVTEAIFQYKYRTGKKTGNAMLVTNALEHRTDVATSAAAFIGVGGAILGTYLESNHWYYLDPAAGLFISFVLLKKNYGLMAATLHSSSDRLLQQEDAADLIETVQRIKGVIAVDDLKAKEHGHYVLVDVRISVNPRITVQEGHDIARTVRHALMKRFTHVSDVMIHVNPYDPGYPYKSQAAEQDDMPTVLH
ncbi:cation diffusion facilitator family transporter [Paenibacillus silviterrae]|uniref:cation diffusion facilitator family transporter n=1 Tax=Paenibacillus silviterrae TaxID=3242194 RepID=UPI002542B168|nr:cation diffusion facilitator family transporter [Paenibacillus chinjuensis]